MTTSEAALFCEHALPADEDLDTFDSGNVEVDSYFRKRAWFSNESGKSSPPTYKFKTREGGETVGYAAASFRNHPQQLDTSTSNAKDLVIYAVGVHVHFQGKQNPRAQEKSFATSLFDILAAKAAEKSNCVALALWVREDNARAIGFYEKFGFLRDEGGPVARDIGARHLGMRKLLR